MNIRPVDFHIDDDYDVCGNTVVAVLEGSGVKIALCKDCVNDLFESVDEFRNTVFCCECESFKMSTSGFRYGGHCQLLHRDKDCMQTCENAHKIVID